MNSATATTQARHQDPAHVLARASLNAGKALGIRQSEVGRLVGRDRSTLQRYGVDPATPNGELALLLVRCYRSLYALMDGDSDLMQHWMHSRNRHTGGVPAEQIRSVTGLVRVCDYLDAIRGKV
jgi:hypothetical protein